MQGSRDNESMEAGVSGHVVVAKVLSINLVAVLWGHFS